MITQISQGLSPSSIVVVSSCVNFVILSLVPLPRHRADLVMRSAKGKTKAADCEEGQGGETGNDAAGKQARVKVAHEGGEPVVDVVDVMGDGHQAKGGEDGEEGGHGAGHQQDNHQQHLVAEKDVVHVCTFHKSTCLVIELTSVGKKAMEAAAAKIKTRPPVIPSPSTTSYWWL